MRRTEVQINPDFLTFLAYTLLVISGWLVLYSVDSELQADSIFKLNYVKQLIWIFASLVVGFVVIYWVKPYQIYFSANFFYIFMLAVVVIVAFVAPEVNGARSWIRIGGFSVQPAEFLKFATALIFARLVAVRKRQPNTLSKLLVVFLPVILAMGAVILQGDMGTALVFTGFLFPAYREGLVNTLVVVYLILFAVFFFLSLTANVIVLFLVIYLISIITLLAYFKEHFKMILTIFLSILAVFHFVNVVFGLKISHLVTISVSLVLSYLLFTILVLNKIRRFHFVLISFLLSISLLGLVFLTPILYNKLKPHQKARIEYYIHPEKVEKNYSTQDVSYNIRQAILSISAGGFKGRGYLKGTHNKLRFVPEQDKDYIFCTVAEELGFWGSLIVFGLFLFLFVQIFRLSERHKSVFVRVYGYSLLGILFIHFAINLGSTLTLLPVIGIPLPFYSYGGSAMLNFTLMLAALINFDRYRTISFEDTYL